ncbi:MAG: NTP transferase domain-containing protein [Nitrospina sp.]|jgi:UDP-N-acetylglucosamine diphosphorylase/glucosamine-1-phosphate N-acetyltransferase|nr:NTP transferase domain-containing protein [Nitrospina sp.]MBT5632299.1 NTP transferase domain-containing protein [Nitrospina sp.]
MQNQDLAVLVLAAGKGTRMKSPLAKVLIPLAGRPLLDYVLDLSSKLNPTRTIVVVGHQADQVKEAFADRGLEFVIQSEQLGTGHAAQQVKSKLENFEGRLVVLCGDMPLIRLDTLGRLLDEHKYNGAKCTLLTLKSSERHDFGRIIRDEDGTILKIVELKDASEAEKKVDEFNSGVYCFDNRLFFKALEHIGADNAQKEYYLTDTIKCLVRNEYSVQAIQTTDADEILGINSPDDLSRAERLLKDHHA